MALKHSVYDTDTHFTINPNTRVLKNESMGKTSLIQYDHNSERFTFEIPRMIEGHDMSKCDVVQVQYNNIDSQTKEQSKGVYDVDDMQISPEDDNVVILSWLISGNATKYVGSLNFLVRFVCTDDEGTVIYAWNTAIYTGISVSTGINNGEAIAYEYADILEQWRAELEKGNNGSVWQELYDHEERIDNLEKTGGGEEVIAEAVQKALTEAKESGEFDGAAGADGEDGQDGANGLSAYEIWLEQGNEGTVDDFLASLVGADGEPGATGATGATGADGYTPVKGTDYFTAEDKAELVEDVLEALPTWTGGSY